MVKIFSPFILISIVEICRHATRALTMSYTAKFQKIFISFRKQAVISLVSSTILLADASNSFASMLTFPLPAPLKNNIILVRAGESFADSRHEIQTNPVKKLRQDNALTLKGREQVRLNMHLKVQFI